MSAQTTYRFDTPYGAPGGIVDLAPYAIDAFLNEEDTGVMLFGCGVVKGTNAGKGIKLPSAATDVFEGITVNGRTTEYDLEGGIHIRNKATVGVMRYGRIYGRLANGVTPAYGDPVYVIASGDEAGYFTTESEDNIAIDAKFMNLIESDVAAIDLHSAKAVTE